jgi:hypothetical protein
MVSEILVGRPIGKHPLVTRTMRQDVNVKMIINDKPRDCDKFCWMELDQDPVH